MEKVDIGSDLQQVLFRGRDWFDKKTWYKGLLNYNEEKKEYKIIVGPHGSLKVDERTVGIFVGRDSKQQDLFTDDIVSVENDLFVVTWSFIDCGYNLVWVKNPDQYMNGYMIRKSVLVGNIFDNPEMLEANNGRYH